MIDGKQRSFSITEHQLGEMTHNLFLIGEQIGLNKEQAVVCLGIIYETLSKVMGIENVMLFKSDEEIH